jgi:hypothetical protein
VIKNRSFVEALGQPPLSLVGMKRKPFLVSCASLRSIALVTAAALAVEFLA